MRCPTGKSGLDSVAKDQFDLILVDLDLNDMSGFDFLEALCLYSTKPTIAIKKEPQETDIVRSLQLGADECLAKPINQLDLIAKCQAVFRRYVGREDVSSVVVGKLRLEADVHRAYLDGREIPLTRNENIIMCRLMQNCGHITSYRNVARAVWGNDSFGANSALRMCVQRLRKKLPISESCVQIVTERGVGFRLVSAR
jgi:DNA-binding response OmpR family regulator